MKFIISIFIFAVTLFVGVFNVDASLASDSLGEITPDVIKNAWDYIADDTNSLDWEWGAGIRALLVNIGEKIMIPIIIVVALVLGFIALYKVMFTEDEAERKKAFGFFLWGVVGILIMYSALTISSWLVWKDGLSGIIWEDVISATTWWTMASQLYNVVLKPFVSIFMYLIIWILLIFLLLSVIKLLTTPDKEETVTSAKTIIIWNIFGILVILSASSLVRLIYGWAANTGATDLWAVSNAGGIFNTKDSYSRTEGIAWIFDIINYFIWFIALLITVFIIYQAYRLLMKPDDEETLNALKRNFVYVLLGLLLMWGVYLIVNFIIV